MRCLLVIAAMENTKAEKPRKIPPIRNSFLDEMVKGEMKPMRPMISVLAVALPRMSPRTNCWRCFLKAARSRVISGRFVPRESRRRPMTKRGVWVEVARETAAFTTKVDETDSAANEMIR